MDMYMVRHLQLSYHVFLGTAQSQVASIPRLFTPRTILQKRLGTHLMTMSTFGCSPSQTSQTSYHTHKLFSGCKKFV